MNITKRKLRNMLVTAYTHGKNDLSNIAWERDYLPEMLK